MNGLKRIRIEAFGFGISFASLIGDRKRFQNDCLQGSSEREYAVFERRSEEAVHNCIRGVVEGLLRVQIDGENSKVFFLY